MATRSSIVFDVDETAKTYLEREVGLQQANRMMANDVHIWYWQARFFRPLQKEEFDVRVDPAGGVVGYTHVQEETALARASNVPRHRPSQNRSCATPCTRTSPATTFAKRKRTSPNGPIAATGVSPGNSADFAPRTRRTD